jgi:signal transduction histidine kinase
LAGARSGGLGPAAYERQRRDGRVLEVQTRRLPDGGAVRTYSDVTERRQNERALAAARDAAEAASRLRAEFMATMSHEIRTPLNAVVGIAGLMGEAELPPHLRRYAGALREAAETLLAVIDDILDFSKLDAGRMEVEAIAFELPALVAGVVDLMEVRAAEKGLALAMNVPAAAPALVGDPGRLRQVLLNLVGNAVKFTEAGRVEVAASLEEAGAGRMRLRVAVRERVQMGGLGFRAGGQGGGQTIPYRHRRHRHRRRRRHRRTCRSLHGANCDPHHGVAGHRSAAGGRWLTT